MSECRVIEGDCLAVLPTLEAGSLDVVITDPPYAQTNESYDSDIACRPDVWRECFRVAKENAALVAFAGSPTYHRIATAIEAGGWKVRQMWAWVYRDGMITSAWPKDGFDRLAPAMDPIVFATKGKVLLNVEREGEAWSKRDNTGWSRKPIGLSARSGNRRSIEADGRFPRTVTSDGVPPFEYFVLPRGGRKPDGVIGHPNQKPLALMRWLVSRFPGGLILDPFAGSGTTGVAALAESRSAVLIEQSPEYCAIARRRIAETVPPLFTAVEATPQINTPGDPLACESNGHHGPVGGRRSQRPPFLYPPAAEAAP